MDAAELQKHNSSGSCWILIDGHIYDVTGFLSEHPGGQAIILKYAGNDASDAFHQVHASNVLEEYIPPGK